MAMVKDFLVAIGAVLVALASCTSCASGPTAPHGMTVVSSSGPTSGPGSMLVAFPRTACTGTDSAVFLDDKGTFVSAVAPGTATYVVFPPQALRLFVVSSRDVTAAPGMWFRRHEITAPGDRVDHGIVVEVARVDAKNCYRSAMPYPQVVSYETATRAALSLTWLDVRADDDGAQWLAEHRARVTQLLGTPPPAPANAPVVTTTTHVP